MPGKVPSRESKALVLNRMQLCEKTKVEVPLSLCERMFWEENHGQFLCFVFSLCFAADVFRFAREKTDHVESVPDTTWMHLKLRLQLRSDEKERKLPVVPAGKRFI